MSRTLNSVEELLQKWIREMGEAGLFVEQDQLKLVYAAYQRRKPTVNKNPENPTLYLPPDNYLG